MQISEIFSSIQGEGYNIGKPSVFVRTIGCDIIPYCAWCDTKYALEGGESLTLLEAARRIKQFDCKHVVFTGGEPLIQSKEIEMIIGLLGKGYTFEVETNGLIYDDVLKQINVINVSPKKQKYDLEVLKKIETLELFKKVFFKFVYETKDDFWWEDVINKLNISNNRVYIMPQGETREEILNKSIEVIEYCKNKNYKFSTRLHILVWGKSRGV